MTLLPQRQAYIFTLFILDHKNLLTGKHLHACGIDQKELKLEDKQEYLGI